MSDESKVSPKEIEAMIQSLIDFREVMEEYNEDYRVPMAVSFLFAVIVDRSNSYQSLSILMASSLARLSQAAVLFAAGELNEDNFLNQTLQ